MAQNSLLWCNIVHIKLTKLFVHACYKLALGKRGNIFFFFSILKHNYFPIYCSDLKLKPIVAPMPELPLSKEKIYTYILKFSCLPCKETKIEKIILPMKSNFNSMYNCLYASQVCELFFRAFLDICVRYQHNRISLIAMDHWIQSFLWGRSETHVPHYTTKG